MKKYWEVAKVIFKIQLVYRFDLVFSMLITVLNILFAIIVWGAIFSENDVVAGFTLGTMLNYYVINSFLSQLDISEGVSGEMCYSIRNGTFSKFMVRPLSVEGYFHAQNYGAALMYMAFNLVATVAWVLLFRIDFALTADPRLLAGGILLVILGLIFLVQLNYFLGLLTFKFQDVGFFLMIKSNLIAFVTGSFIPLALLPQALVGILRWLPFYYIHYLPSMLFLGLHGEEMFQGFLILGAWVLALIPINKAAYGILRRRYDGVGI